MYSIFCNFVIELQKVFSLPFCRKVHIMILGKEARGMSQFYLSTDEMQRITQSMENLNAEGIVVSENHSGEMNFSGCATGYCQAWD